MSEPKLSRLFSICVLLLIVCAWPLWTVHAAESRAVSTAHATVSLISEFDTAQRGQAQRLGLRFRLNPGWHIYSQNPGDAGVPPHLQLHSGQRLQNLPWPTVVTFTEGGLTTYGYKGEVVLPWRMQLDRDDGVVDATADWLVCNAICIPEQARLTLNLRAETSPGSAQTVRITSDMGPSWRMLILFAFTGGLLLNVMPCVFPILAIKTLALAALPGKARARARAEGIAYTAGVFTCFAGFGLLLRAVHAAGMSAGWGFQFQSPSFVIAMAWLLFLIALNLNGVYAIGVRWAGLGQGWAGRGGLFGSYCTGLLAVMVATPCTAPFMGAAVGAGIALPAAKAWAIFAAMAAGFAGPFMLAALTPAIACFLPKPGLWMEMTRQGLAFPLYGAVLWLIWVVSQQGGATGILTAGGGLLVIGFVAWIIGQAQRYGRSVISTLVVCGAAVIMTALLCLSQPSQAISPTPLFSEQRIESVRAAGHPVLVDLTAAWCITCLVNERLVLHTDAVQRLLAQHDVVTIIGDWTRGDAAITAYLNKFGRNGVPLYVFYPKDSAPMILPQLLTQQSLRQALDNK